MEQDFAKPMKGLFILMRGGAMMLAVLMVLLVVVAVIGPTLEAAGSYMIRRHEITVQGVALRIPLGWELKVSNNHIACIQKRSYVLSDFSGAGDLVFLTGHGSQPPLAFSAKSESDFKDANSRIGLVPFRLNDRWSHCIRVPDKPGGGWVTVGCWDDKLGVEFEFIGNDSNLAEAESLVE